MHGPLSLTLTSPAITSPGTMSGALTQARAWHWDGASLDSLDFGEGESVNAATLVAKTSARDSQRSIARGGISG